jgi:hypothetical protein
MLCLVKKAEIKRIAEYLKDAEEALVELDYSGPVAEYHLSQLREIIKKLMDATCSSTQY